MSKIIESSELPEHEKVFLKKDSFGWRVVNPFVIDDKKQWMNIIFGGKRNLFILIAVLVVLLLLYIGVSELIESYKIIADNPCLYCEDCATALQNYPTFP